MWFERNWASPDETNRVETMIGQERTAFITGGASGIGFALAQALGRRGMKIVIADIEASAIEPALEALRSEGVEALGVNADVSGREAVEDAAEQARATFGNIHFVANNAGVLVADPIGKVSCGDWKWIMDVNLKGVVNGVSVFLPHMLAHEEGGFFLNTASMAGLMSIPTYEPYTATKYAVVAMTEGWAQQLADRSIGFSVFCPGVIWTRISTSRRNRNASYGGEPHKDLDAAGVQDVKGGLSPEIAARYVLDCVDDGHLYIVTHPEFAPFVEQRLERIRAGVAATARSASLKDRPKQKLPVM